MVGMVVVIEVLTNFFVLWRAAGSWTFVCCLGWDAAYWSRFQGELSRRFLLWLTDQQARWLSFPYTYPSQLMTTFHLGLVPRSDPRSERTHLGSRTQFCNALKGTRVVLFLLAIIYAQLKLCAARMALDGTSGHETPRWSYPLARNLQISRNRVDFWGETLVILQTLRLIIWS